MEACGMTSSERAVPESASSASDRSIFLTGATGYVGGSYLQILLSLPQTAKKITTLVRSEEKAKLLEKLPGVEAVVGSFDDLDLLTRLAAEHDVTIETADSDNPELMDALLKGFEKRHAQGLKTDFIHVSGTGTLVDEAKGEYPTDTIYTDGEPKSPNVKHISTLPESAFHRKIDLAIVAADKKGWCNSYIILPGTIWGDAQGEIFDKGIANPHSKQIPQQAQASIDRGKAGMVGKGLNVWPHVHIEDVASQFETVYTASLDGKAEHGEKGYFFATSGEYRLLEATQAIGEALAKNGLSKTADVDSFSEDEITKIYSALEKIGGSKYYSGTNSRAESAQATALGWSPKHTSVEEFYKYCRDETERLGKQSK